MGTVDGWPKDDCLKMFKGVDKNGDGKISLEEFIEWVMKGVEASKSGDQVKKEAETPEEVVAEAAKQAADKAEMQAAAPYLHELFEIQKKNYYDLMNLPVDELMAMMFEPEKAKEYEEKQQKMVDEQLKPLFQKSFKHHDSNGNDSLSKEEAAVFFSHFTHEQGAFLKSMIANQLRTEVRNMIASVAKDASAADKDQLEKLKVEAEAKIKETVGNLKTMLNKIEEDYNANKADRDAAAFKVLDVNGDGSLAYAELEAAVFPKDPTDPMPKAFNEALGFTPP